MQTLHSAQVLYATLGEPYVYYLSVKQRNKLDIDFPSLPISLSSCLPISSSLESTRALLLLLFPERACQNFDCFFPRLSLFAHYTLTSAGEW